LEGAGDRAVGVRLRMIWGPSAELYLRMISDFAVVKTVGGDGVDAGFDMAEVSDAAVRRGERGSIGGTSSTSLGVWASSVLSVKGFGTLDVRGGRSRLKDEIRVVLGAVDTLLAPLECP